MKKKAKVIQKKQAVSEDLGVKKTKIRVIGIGGGGGSIVSEIAAKMPKASFVIANTDSQALKNRNKKASVFNFGQSLTHGLGTGMNAGVGREAALLEKDKIKKLMEGYDLCILVSCLGGGTGSGAAPVFAKISRSLGNLTYGIFTLPLKFEGEKKMEMALEALKEVKNYLNAVTLIPNEKVFQVIDKSTPLREAFSIVNKHLSESLGGLIETIYEPGIINIDFADLRTVLDGRGRVAYLNTIETEKKEGSLKEFLSKILSSPFYPYSVKGAKGVLLNITGEKSLSLDEVNQISKTISDLTNAKAKIIFGVSQKSKNANSIKTTVFATGCSFKLDQPKSKEAIKKSALKKKKVEKKKRKNKPKIQKRKTIKKRRKPKPKKEESVAVPVKVEMERKNGLQVKHEVEEVEKELQEKEDIWETPAFLRQNEQEK
ncbi:MAG: cell division protein FtsZ [Candidatus Paceibacterota bacterium]|jgi:cell division protein FtsZ